VTRWTILLPDRRPLGGRCPACGATFDDSGCRLLALADVLENDLGVERAGEVLCHRLAPPVEAPA
jgi:hypothetical protein